MATEQLKEILVLTKKDGNREPIKKKSKVRQEKWRVRNRGDPKRLEVLRKTIMKKARMMYDEMTKNEKENDSKVDSLAGAGLL